MCSPPAEKTLVFAPTFNERETVVELLDSILRLPVPVDVLIVDDSSTDGTTEYLQSRSGAEPRLKIIVRQHKLGIGSAHKIAWAYARQNGYRNIVKLDADLSNDPADIPRFLEALEHGCDVAIGSRFAPGGTLEYTGWRRLVSIAGNRFAAAVLRLPFREYTTSFRAARLAAVPPGVVESIAADHYAFFVSCVVAFARAGLRIVELPIRFSDRRGGRSKLPQHAILTGAANVLRLALDRKAPVPARARDEADRRSGPR